jgi:hypothetical protein
VLCVVVGLRRHRLRGEQRDNGKADHSGRTFTTLNMPACMCISMWQ